MDLSKLSDSDLQALLDGDMQAVSDEGLKIVAGPSAYEKTAQGQSFGENLLTGIGGGMTSLYLGAKQAMGLASDDELWQNRDAMDGLRSTWGGKIGDVTGKAALAAPAMFVPGANTLAGASLVGAGLGAAEPVLGDESRGVNAAFGAAGGAAGMGLGKALGAGAKSVFNKAAASAASRASQNALRDSVIGSSRTAGYSIPPSYMNAGMIPRLLEGLSGKYKTNQLAGIKNQSVTNGLARKALGQGTDATLNREALSSIRQQAFNDGYAPVRAAGAINTDRTFSAALDGIESSFAGASRSFPGASSSGVSELVGRVRVPKFDAGDAIDMTRLLRSEADQAFAARNNELGKAARKAASALEDQIERHLSAAGDDGAAMLKAFKSARTQIAKTHSVERALVEATGDIDATKLAAQLAKGKPLSGELLDAAKFAQAFPDVARIPKSGNANPLTVMDFMYSGGLAGATANPAMLALPAGRVAARYGILSPMMQKFMGPSYSTAGKAAAAKALNSITAKALGTGLGSQFVLLSPSMLPTNK